MYQYNFFNVYGNTSSPSRPPMLSRMATYPVLGNHEVYSWLYQAAENGGYRTAFGDALLMAGQGSALSGGPGVPSGTWRYYSANYGRVHIVALDSMTTRSNTSSAWRAAAVPVFLCCGVDLVLQYFCLFWLPLLLA